MWLLFLKKVYDALGLVFVSGENLDTQILKFNIYDFSITNTIHVTEKSQFNGDEYCICDWENTYIELEGQHLKNVQEQYQRLIFSYENLRRHFQNQ